MASWLKRGRRILLKWVGEAVGQVGEIHPYVPSLGILAHRTSEDERLGCTITETKRKVSRFHETILRR